MLKEKIREDFNNARKSGDLIVKSSLEAIIAGILIKEKAGLGIIDDSAVLECIQKEIKIQKEITQLYKDLAPNKSAEALAKVSSLQIYLPEQLTEEEVFNIIAQVDTIKDGSLKSKGMIMKGLMPCINGKFDKSKVNDIVEKYLKSI